MDLWRILVFFIFSVFSIVSSEDPLDSPHHNHQPLPRPVIRQYIEKAVSEPLIRTQYEEDELHLQCTSWRFAVEANNLNQWKTIPSECADYVKTYMIGRGYALDLDRVSNEASAFARNFRLGDDGKDVWIFDVDETLISNLPYYADHGYGLEIFDHLEFDKWVEKGIAPAIEPSLRLYEEVRGLGFKVFLLTGRTESHWDVTVQNLMNVGFKDWDKLILRASEDHGKLARVYKSDKRNAMVNEGYRIIGNSGDQWSDLLGSSLSIRSFKLPNPMYYIP